MAKFYDVCRLIFLSFFSLFAFSMFASMPTGVATTSSSLAFLAAIPLFIKFLGEYRLSSTETMGLLLFCCLFASIFWGGTTFVDGLESLSEYRIFLMLPVFVGAMGEIRGGSRLVLGAIVSGAAVSLLISYAIFLGWLPTEGESMSRGNHIYHGFIMSVTYFLALIMSRQFRGLRRYLCLVFAILIGLNVMAVEDGRTGYLQVILSTSVFLLLTFSWKKTALFSGILAAILASTWWGSVTLHTELRNTYINLERAVGHSDTNSSVGMRLEFYRNALEIVSEHPVVGVGVASTVTELERRYREGKMKVYSDNVHSEFLNMSLAAGVLGLALFSAFLCAIAYDGMRARRAGDSGLGDCLIGLAAIVLVSAMFNSTIKDFGEKHVLIVTLSACLASLAGLIRRAALRGTDVER